jgi:hypothetical protein
MSPADVAVARRLRLSSCRIDAGIDVVPILICPRRKSYSIIEFVGRECVLRYPAVGDAPNVKTVTFCPVLCDCRQKLTCRFQVILHSATRRGFPRRTPISCFGLT